MDRCYLQQVPSPGANLRLRGADSRLLRRRWHAEHIAAVKEERTALKLTGDMCIYSCIYSHMYIYTRSYIYIYIYTEPALE